MDYGKKVLASLNAKMEKTNSALAALWFGKWMDFVRSLVDGVTVTIDDFTTAIRELAGNPMLAAATDEEKGMIQHAIIEHPQALHQDGLKVYIIATGNKDIADFFIDQMLALEPAFEEEILFNDPRCLLIKQAYAAIEATCPENIQRFAEVVLATFPHLPYGKDSNGGGLRGLIEIASERGSKRQPTEMPKSNNGGLQAHDGRGGVKPVARRDDSPRGPKQNRNNDGGGKRPTPKMPDVKYSKPGDFSLDDSELPPVQHDSVSRPDRTLTRDEDLPSPTPRKKRQQAGTMAAALAPLKADLPKGDPTTSIN